MLASKANINVFFAISNNFILIGQKSLTKEERLQRQRALDLLGVPVSKTTIKLLHTYCRQAGGGVVRGYH